MKFFWVLSACLIFTLSQSNWDWNIPKNYQYTEDNKEIIRYDFEPGKSVQHIKISQNILGKKGDLARIHDVTTFVHSSTEITGVQIKTWLMSSAYKYKRTTLPYSKALKYLERYDVDLSKYTILTDLVVISEGELINTFYCSVWGQREHHGNIKALFCSDTYDHVVFYLGLPKIIGTILLVIVVLGCFAAYNNMN